MRTVSGLSRTRWMGRRLSAGRVDDTVRVWEAASGAELLKLEGHEGPVNSVAYSPDGAQIVSGSD